jgi:hypothetical protein
MKTFIATHDGIFLPGYSVVIAKDEKSAKEMLIKLLKEHLLKTKDITLEEIDITIPNAKMIWDGDY